MKLFAVLLFVGVTTAAKLSSSYISPSTNGYKSADHGILLQAPVDDHYLTQSSKLSQQTYHQQGEYQNAHYQQHAQTNQYDSHHSHHSHQHGEEIPILRLENDNHGDGNYRFGFETANGIVRDEEGHLANAGTDHEEQVVSGSYSYTGDDGKVYTVHYTADSNGFRATGDHLPTPPPIPEAIQRSLEYNAAHSHDGDSGSYSHHELKHERHLSRQQKSEPKLLSGFDQLSGGYELAGAYSQTQHLVAPQTTEHDTGYEY